MRRWLVLLVSALLLTALSTGCSGDKEKGTNANKDKPKAID
jgi:hypothetical protein